MIDLVVKQAKTGTWKNVVPYGGKLPTPPYIVVKEEPTNLGYTRYRFIGHALPEQILPLRSYMRKDLYTLFNNITLSGVLTDTRKCILKPLPGELGTISTGNADGTISLERSFYTPEIL